MESVKDAESTARHTDSRRPELGDSLSRTIARPSLLHTYEADSLPALATATSAVATAELTSLLSPDLQTQPELAATIYNAAGVAYLNRGHIDLARKYVEMSLDLRQNFYGEEHPAVAESLQSRARLRRHDGDLKGAEKDIRRALGIHRGAGAYGLAMAATLWELSVIQLENAEFAVAGRSAREGVEIIQKLYLDRSDPYMPRLMDVIARVHLARGEYTEAVDTYARILSDVSEKQGDRHPKYATYLANLGSVEEVRGNLVEAEECYSKAIDIYERVNGKHPNLGGVYVNMGALQQAKGAQHFDSARLFYSRALALSRDIHGPLHAFFAYDEFSLARLEFESGNFAEARRLAEDALRIYRATQPGSGYAASTLTLLARTVVQGTHRDLRSGGYDAALDEARERLREALTIFRKEQGERSVHFAFARAVLGRAMFIAGDDPIETRRTLQASHAMLEQLVGPEDGITKLAAQWLEDLDPKRIASN